MGNPGMYIPRFSASVVLDGADKVAKGRFNIHWEYEGGHYGMSTASMFDCSSSLTSSAASFSLQVWNTGSGYGFGNDSQNDFIPGGTKPDPGTETMKFQIDPADPTSFMITGSSTAADTNVIYFSGSGKIGFNTTDPQRALDIVDDTPGVAEYAIKRKMDDSQNDKGGYVVGTEIAKLKFIGDSGSFDSEVSGTAAEISTIVSSIDGGGAINGKLVLRTFYEMGVEPLDILEVGLGLATDNVNSIICNGEIKQSGQGGSSKATFGELHPTEISMSHDTFVNYGRSGNSTDFLTQVTPVAGTGSGDILRIGAKTTVAGKIYQLTSSSDLWVLADSGSAVMGTGLLAVALGTNSTTRGMMLRGMVKLADDPGGDVGRPVYLAAPGKADDTVTGTAGDIARVVGYNVGTAGQIWFNPDNTWVERS
jgi:hypothetical protein